MKMMKTGTVKWFNLQKGHGFIHPDDGSPNILVDVFAAECVGMSGLKEGQRLRFEIRSNKRTGEASAVSLALEDAGATAMPPPPDRRFAMTNPFDSISDMISSALWRLWP